ncbi:M1 family metallopeptidase [Croceibacterium ferulae]|uniref:M1 family metallopeptidase n=1 Tax=Croceibacterium ferulae TaxID=1854641 RepID=UPI000EACBB06|nr:M1 family metallopeptidase [Croceibacterium ferulae]
MRLLAPAALCLTAACTTVGGEQADRMISPVLTTAEARDEYTFARPEIARVTHVDLDLALDFRAQTVGGTATLDIAAASGAQEIILDSRGLQISGITAPGGSQIPFTVGETIAGKGEPVTVRIGDARQITVNYTSGAGADALQWLAPQQTAGGEHPFMFSQGQAINNRTWIPTQDSPGIRQTWHARVTAPATLDVVMSGIRQGDAQDVGGGRRAFTFTMDQPVAPYLIAVAAGDIDFRPLGPRSGVWAEPATLDRAAAELVDTEAMIDAAEGLYGDYRWGRYDMIVLPPSFPYGGMENPVMTFLTPTFIAGDRSLTGLVAHELAHSWSGNLVTYASWRDGWLNEGVTSYLENRISEVVFGDTRAGQERALSYAGVVEAVEELGANAPGTALRTPDGLDPLDYNSTITYDKGALFLHTAESIVGRDRFDPWLRSWFDRHAFQPATSAMFLADLRENLIGGDAALEQRLMLDQWVYGTGIPANVARADDQAFAAVDAAARAYGADRTLDAQAWTGWSAAEQMRFLQTLPQTISAEELARLDRTLNLSATGNTEVKFLWLQAGLRNRYQPVVPQAEAFLASVGRNKFVEPLFRTLTEQGEWGQPIARRIYDRTRPTYHSFTRGKVDRLLGVTG